MATDYSKLQGYQEALDQSFLTGVGHYWGTGYGWGNKDKLTGQLSQNLNQIGDQFTNQFTNLVGRAPTQDELTKFFTEHAGQTLQATPGFDIAGNQASVRSDIQRYIGDTFNQTAQQYATQRLQDQQNQANDLANTFQAQGTNAINQTQQSLLDYQSKLFERLRPNLITSLQSQGLLNTGGFNEALAGVQGDLANNASNYIAQLQLNNQQAANQIRFGGASAPYYYQQGQITNQPNYLQGEGANAANFNNNTFMSNLDYVHQLGLINAQSQTQPSFLRQFALAGAQGVAQGVGQGVMALAKSARKFKKDITQLTKKEENELYDRLVKMPLSIWKYKGESRDHLGVITDEALPEVVTKDKDHLHVVDYLGILTLALKVQHRRMVENHG